MAEKTISKGHSQVDVARAAALAALDEFGVELEHHLVIEVVQTESRGTVVRVMKDVGAFKAVGAAA